MAASSPSLGFLTVLVVVIVVGAGVGAGVLYLYNHPRPPGTPATVQIGDNATVNYIGIFGSGPQVGKVFDTSILDVAKDNATYPKSLEYTPRNVSGYEPLPVHVGPNTPSGGYVVGNVTYSSVVTGFWRGLIGLAVGETRRVTVDPSAGYGPLNASCLRTAPLVQTIAAAVVYTAAQFSANYSGVTAAAGTTFRDPTYGWNDTVVSANSSAVVVERSPYVGETTKPYGWTILVENVSAGRITLASQLSPSSVGTVLGTIPTTTVCSTTSFLVWNVAPANGTYTQNYNREVVGETLIFVVTVVSILPP